MSPTGNATYTRTRGMTLIELLVAMAIFATIMSGVMLMFVSVTDTVRRSYRTMDVFEATQGALMAIERDVQTSFSSPATGADFHFYGEPYGFIMVGIAPDEHLGRLTYAVHVDTSRMELPGTFQWRGEQVTIPLRWDDVYVDGLENFYPSPPPANYMDFEVEILYGLLVRRYEHQVTDFRSFPDVTEFENDRLFAPVVFYGTEEFEDHTFTSYLLHNTNLSVPRRTEERLNLVERCHYWLQLLQGPGIPSPTPWNPLYIWENSSPGAYLYWRDHHVPDSLGEPDPVGKGGFLWDYVVARDFVISAWLLDPATGERIIDPNTGLWAQAFPNQPPVFQYGVESSLARGYNTPTFNTMFNLNHQGAFEELVYVLSDSQDEIDSRLRQMIEYRQFYDVGNPLQARLPGAITVTLFVVNPPATTGAPTDMFNFAQTIHIPSGFLRRSQAIE